MEDRGQKEGQGQSVDPGCIQNKTEMFNNTHISSESSSDMDKSDQFKGDCHKESHMVNKEDSVTSKEQGCSEIISNEINLPLSANSNEQELAATSGQQLGSGQVGQNNSQECSDGGILIVIDSETTTTKESNSKIDDNEIQIFTGQKRKLSEGDSSHSCLPEGHDAQGMEPHSKRFRDELNCAPDSEKVQYVLDCDSDRDNQQQIVGKSEMDTTENVQSNLDSVNTVCMQSSTEHVQCESESLIITTVGQTSADDSDNKDNMQSDDKVDPSNTDQIDETYYSQEGMVLTEKPSYITEARTDFNSTDENFLKGCKWAPDGTCILTNSNDNCLRLFNLPQPLYEAQYRDIPELTPVLKFSETDTIYDYCWYPKMTFDDPNTQCLLSTSKDSPVHLWDANTGQIRGSYRPYNHLDEMTSAYSLAFNYEATKIYCGFNKVIRIFDLTRPGRDFVTRPTYYNDPHSRGKTGQPGIISCIVPSPQDNGMYAAGSYSRTIAVYCEPKGQIVCMFEGQQGGVTHLAFSPDGTKLYSGGRKDPEIICWDLRNPGQILFVALRQVLTNQRIYFELDRSGQYMFSGSHDGTVNIWDTTVTPEELFPGQDSVLKVTNKFQAHKDTVNGISLHPYLPLLASSSGQRHFPSVYDSDSSEDEASDIIENTLKLWAFPKV